MKELQEKWNLSLHWTYIILTFLQASKYKAAILPVAGALIGTVVAGPVGLIAGAKIGGMAAIGGGMAGKCLKRQKVFFFSA